MRLFRRHRKPKVDPLFAAWILAFAEERRNAPPWQTEFQVPETIRIEREEQ